jgi:hypothetical protein
MWAESQTGQGAGLGFSLLGLRCINDGYNSTH